jgi:MFS family permease
MMFFHHLRYKFYCFQLNKQLFYFLGFLGSMFSFLQFVASPVVGGLSDVYGRKPVMLICLVS